MLADAFRVLAQATARVAFSSVEYTVNEAAGGMLNGLNAMSGPASKCVALSTPDRRGLLPVGRARSKLRDGAARTDKQNQDENWPSELCVSFSAADGLQR